MARGAKAKPVPMRNVRTMVPPSIFEALQAEAEAHGVTLAAHVRACLAEHVNGSEPAVSDSSDTEPPKLTKAIWEDCKAWWKEHDVRQPDDVALTAEAMYVYALTIGFKP